jgi:serine protease Do
VQAAATSLWNCNCNFELSTANFPPAAFLTDSFGRTPPTSEQVSLAMGFVGTSAVLISVFALGGCTTWQTPDLAFTPGPHLATPKTSVTKVSLFKPRAQKEEEEVLPPWTVVKPSKPSHESKTPLNPSQLFARVAPSVYVVRAMRKTKSTSLQGSAVAISTSEAITNCHVVVHAKSITVSQGAKELAAEIIIADPQSDRCYLKVHDGTLNPILGLRGFSDLAIGETVYTIGSPRGLDSTLAQGLLSGLRKMAGTHYIQISAPISNGSSGGGLFDDKGNLIGITTLMMKDSQNLNFAIAASEYWD